MLTVLPIKLLHESDQAIFGQNILNLSKLRKHHPLVPDGLAVAPPEFVLKTVVKHLQTGSHESFEQSLKFLEKELLSQPAPEYFVEETKGKKEFLYRYQLFNKAELVWKALLKTWLEQIRSYIWRHGFNQGLNKYLTTELVFFFGERFFQVEAYFDDQTNQVVVNSEKSLQLDQVNGIKHLVEDGNKKLFLPQVYKLIIAKNSLHLLSVQPFTHPVPGSVKQELSLPQAEVKQVVKAATKVFINLSSGFLDSQAFDGAILDGEDLGDFETTAFKLAQAASSLKDKPVIYKLPDLTNGDINGTLRLLTHKSLLDQSSEAFLFVRNKKSLLNLELALPMVRSDFELSEIKKELSARGIHRKGLLRLWLELTTPENLINLNDYLEVGVDGVIIDLDQIHGLINGFNNQNLHLVDQSIVSLSQKNQLKALQEFIQPALKTLHKAKVLVIVKGKMILESEIIDSLLDSGVWAIVSNNILEAESLPEHLSWAEKRMVSRRLS